MPSETKLTTNVLLCGEETGGNVSVTEIVVPPHTAGPPLHTHDFDDEVEPSRDWDRCWPRSKRIPLRSPRVDERRRLHSPGWSRFNLPAEA